jgi:hypothetical protein
MDVKEQGGLRSSNSAEEVTVCSFEECSTALNTTKREESTDDLSW